VNPLPKTARRDLALAVAAGTLAAALMLAFLIGLGEVVDGVFLRGASIGDVATALWCLAGLMLARAIVGSAGDGCASRASGAAKVALRRALAASILRRGPAGLSGERAGELLNTAIGRVDALDAHVGQYLPHAALAAIVPPLVWAVVTFLDPLSGLVLLTTGPLIPLFTWLIGGAAAERTRAQWEALSRLSARFVDALYAFGTLKAFGALEEERRVIEAGAQRYRQLTMRVLRVAFLSALALELLATIGTAIIAVEVGLRVLYGRLGFREALIVLLLAPEFYRPLRALAASFHAGMAGREAIARVGQVVAETTGDGTTSPETGSPAGAPATSKPEDDSASRVRASAGSVADGRPMHAASVGGPPSLTFEDVSFTWSLGRRVALTEVAFEVDAGDTLALVGPNGAGKTTAAMLLLRFIAPTAGRVLANGRDLSAIPIDTWRRHVGWVPQHPHLFHGSLIDNLRLGRPDAPVSEVERALHLAGLESLVAELPGGLGTPVGEGGERLSGGQAARVALARAFLKDAPLLILDEPSAHLDPELDAVLQAAIGELRRGRTVVLIAHRLTSVIRADTVVVLSEGRVVECGQPRALLAADGPFARMAAACGVVT